MDCDTGAVENRVSNMALFVRKSCPTEAELLAFREQKLPAKKRTEIEKHLASCDDCRESLALVAELELDNSESETRGIVIADSVVNQQVLSVLDLIEKDEREYVAKPLTFPKRGSRPRWIAVAAMLTLTAGLGVWSISNLWSPSPIRQASRSEHAMNNLRAAVEYRGVTDARLVGLPFASPSAKRSESGPSDLRKEHIDEAKAGIKGADHESASAEDQLAYASVLLVDNQADKAREVLTRIVDSGGNSAEVFNNLGVVCFKLEEYHRASEWFEKALAVSPDLEEARFNQAVAIYEEAKTAGGGKKTELRTKALALFTEFINSEPSDAKSHKEARQRVKDLSNNSN